MGYFLTFFNLASLLENFPLKNICSYSLQATVIPRCLKMTSRLSVP